MSTSTHYTIQLVALKKEYESLKPGKESLITLLDESEIPESVYNSNAIENSTLTLKETEKILLEMEVERNVSLREVFEAKNLARVSEFMRKKAAEGDLSKESLLVFHEMLLGNIDDSIAGRFRAKGEYVRVGTHIAAAPENIESLLDELFITYRSDVNSFFIDLIARFHLGFESVHPFNDGNGRIGRLIINYQLHRFGFPPIIIRDKEKQYYYRAFNEYNATKKTKPMEQVVMLAILESLHKRIAYLKGSKIVLLADFIRTHGKKAPSVLNAARRQTIPAFREKGVWKIAEDFKI